MKKQGDKSTRNRKSNRLSDADAMMVLFRGGTIGTPVEIGSHSESFGNVSRLPTTQKTQEVQSPHIHTEYKTQQFSSPRIDGHVDIERYIPQLTRFAISLTGDRDAAYDLVQDTVMRFLTRDSEAEQIENIQSFMMSTLRNLFIDHKRRVSKSPKETPVGLQLTPKEVMAALSKLPEDVAAPLVAHARDNKSYSDISRELGVPIGTVMSRISRARSALKELLINDKKLTGRELSKIYSDPYLNKGL